jgi:hypothetical protein
MRMDRNEEAGRLEGKKKGWDGIGWRKGVEVKAQGVGRRR